MKKAIIFDVDGVITDSGESKELVIQRILERYGLFSLPGVSEIFGKGFNRILLMDLIYEIEPFDKKAVLTDVNRELGILESKVSLIPDTFEFIKKNSEKYLFFTNTSLPKSSLIQIFQDLEIKKYFDELFAYDDGSKKENVEYIMKEYDLSSKNVLFIDDKTSHLNNVEPTGVHLLHFQQDGVPLGKKINSIFGE